MTSSGTGTAAGLAGTDNSAPFSGSTTTTTGPGASSTSTPSVPVLGEGFADGNTSGQGQGDQKSGKRRFWNMAKKTKKEDKSATPPTAATAAATSQPPPAPSTYATAGGQRAVSPQASAVSPAGTSFPGSQAVRSPSPRLASPASSQIFERNVQEDVVSNPAAAASPAIPSHITTENHIPPVLDASSMAITNDHLDPDSVEIVTHAAHQPAAVAVNSGLHHGSSDAPPISPLSDEGGGGEATALSSFSPDTMSAAASGAAMPVGPGSDDGDRASTYGALDSADVRRLSFISFADVVHAEHAATASSQADHASIRDSLVISAGPSSIASPIQHAARSPSPIRSPISPPLSSSLSGSPNTKGIEGSPSRSGLVGTGAERQSTVVGPGAKMVAAAVTGAIPSSPGLGYPGGSPPLLSGELTIETMSQALRKTGSGDLSGFRGSNAGLSTSDDGPMINEVHSSLREEV